jgi:hypothetical protein
VTQIELADRSSRALAARRGRRTRVTLLVRARRSILRSIQGIRKGWRWLERRCWPGARGRAVITTLVALTVVAGFVTIVFVHYNWWSRGNTACENNDLGCHLGTHLVIDGLLAGLGVWFFLHGEATAARSWRRTVRRRPEWLFLDWLPNPKGLTGDAAWASDDDASDTRRARGESVAPIEVTAIGREDLAKSVIADLNETGDAQILVGDSGAGKTVLLMVIAKQLARQGQVPIAITLRSGSSKDIEKSARRAFIATVTGTAKLERAWVRRGRAKDHEQAEKWWNWLRRRSLITVLVDDLEKDEQKDRALRVQALERAASQHLRLVVASRSSGLPPDYRRGRVDVGPIDSREIVDDLESIALRKRAAGKSPPSREAIRELADRADIGRTPYYLAIARVLAERGLFPNLEEARDARVALLDAYRDGLLKAQLAPASGLSEQTRKAVLYQLEAIAFVRILRTRKEAKVASKAIQYRQPPRELSYQEVFDLARRLTILESRYDGEIHFAHPTTLAYFAARFVRGDSSGGAWKKQLAEQPHLSATLIAALILAVAGDDEMVRWGCGELLRRIKSTSPDPLEVRSEEDSQEKLALCAAAAEMLATLEQPDRQIVRQIAEAARSEAVVGQRLIAEKKRVVAALSRVRAYDEIWAYAREHQEYPVRREASRLLARAHTAHRTLTDELTSMIDAADHERQRCPAHPDDNNRVIDELKPVAWMFPSLRMAAADDRERRTVLNALQERLIDLSLDQKLTVQRGLEASVAQGLKLAAREHLGQVDPYTEAMLDHANGTPIFWYSRVMLAQALALQGVAAPDSGEPEGDRRAIDRRLARLAKEDPHPFVRETARLCRRAIACRRWEPYFWATDRRLARLAKEDPHPFVRETARLCRRAIARRRWERYIWTDATEIVTGVPQELSIEAAQLAADIVIALNLNAHQNPEMRTRFGAAKALPGCLGPGGARDAILGHVNPPDDCPLDQRSEAERVRRVPVRCACPYLYNSTDLKIDARRELSRAFCRHQRMNARPPRWQEDVESKALRRFWDHMETLARF